MIDRTAAREAGIAVALATITGYVDAIGYTRLFEVFPANQTGNVVFFGVAIGDGEAGQAWRPGLAMLAFLVGVMVGMVLAHRIAPRTRMSLLLAIETALLALVAALAGDVQGRTAPFGGGREVVMLAAAAVAMGIQTDVIRRAAQVGVWTTFTTGAMVQFTDELTEAVVHGRVPNPRGRRTLVVVGAVVGMYIGGAAIGTAIVDEWGAALWLAVVATAALAVWLAIRPPANVAPIE
mgnify:CR=1 FL=1